MGHTSQVCPDEAAHLKCHNALIKSVPCRFAREKKMSANTIMLLRTASEKISNTLVEFNKIKAEKEKFAEQEKKKKEAGPKGAHNASIACTL